jgi:hypothetical protein
VKRKTKIIITLIILFVIISVTTLSFRNFPSNPNTNSTITTPTLTTSSNPTIRLNFLDIQSAIKFVEYFEIINYRYFISSSLFFNIIYQYIGKENLNGTLAYTIKIFLNSTNEINIYVFWIDIASYQILKAKKGDEQEVTGKYAQNLWNYIDRILIFPFERFNDDLLKYLNNNISFNGKENKSYYYTNLTIYKYSTTNIINNINKSEFWVTKINEKDFLVYYILTYSDNTQIKYELISIKLIS